MTQQYTCPYCFKDYTRFTIQDHYECGVEPLEDESPKVKPEQSDCVAQEKQSASNSDSGSEENSFKAETPKKRGRKPKQA